MPRCKAQRDTYGDGNRLILIRCVKEEGHADECDRGNCPERQRLAAKGFEGWEPFCDHRHEDARGDLWPSSVSWKPGDPNQADLWAAMSKVVSRLPHV